MPDEITPKEKLKKKVQATEENPPEPVDDQDEEDADDLMPPQDPPKKVVRKEQKINSLAYALRPLIDQINAVDAKLEKALNPEPIAPKDPPKRGYKLFDEFDPSLGGEA